METELETGEWLTPEEFCRRTGYLPKQLKNFLSRNCIPECYIKRKNRSRMSGIVAFRVDLVDLTIQRRAENEKRLDELKALKNLAEEERWLTVDDVAKATHTPKDRIEALLQAEVLPFSMVKRIDGETRLHAGLVTAINDKKPGFMFEGVEQPPDAVHVPDPDGKYPGFWLTPEQAIMLSEIRIHHRRHGGGASDSNCKIGIFQAERGTAVGGDY